MIPTEPASSRYRSLHTSRRVLARAAPLVRYGLMAVGVSVFLDQVRPMISDAEFTWGERRVMAIVAVSTLGGFALASWLAGRLLRAIAELLEVVIDGAEATIRTGYLLESQVVPAILRATAAMERLAESQTQANPGRPAEAIRRAIEQRQWSRAERLLQGLRRDDPEAIPLGAELTRARQAEVDGLRARLRTAQAADDLDQVIGCRDALTQHLRGDALHDLDHEVVRWLVEGIQRRVRGGPVTPETVQLVTRVVDSFGDTAEGAALLAALPKLRRRAGL